MKVLAIIQGCPIYLHDDGHVSFFADADIDCDGVDANGNPNNIYNDPYYQPDTTLKHNGKSLNALTEAYIVVPPAIVRLVGPVVMGCQARVHYRQTSELAYAVVGDIGPSKKVGEISVRCAQKVKMPSNPNSGGEDNMEMVLYELWPGKAAVVDGIQYQLQPTS